MYKMCLFISEDMVKFCLFKKKTYQKFLVAQNYIKIFFYFKKLSRFKKKLVLDPFMCYFVRSVTSDKLYVNIVHV